MYVHYWNSQSYEITHLFFELWRKKKYLQIYYLILLGIFFSIPFSNFPPPPFLVLSLSLSTLPHLSIYV